MTASPHSGFDRAMRRFRILAGCAAMLLGLPAPGATAGDAADLEARVALARLTDAARAGDAAAQFALAEHYASRPVPVENEAVLWWSEAARQGHTDAVARLAAAIEAGRGLRADPVRAEAFWRRAADLGAPDALWRMARTAEDPEEADAWLARAVARDQPDALLERARQLLAGEDPDARDRAWDLTRRAARLGHPEARLALARHLAESDGDPADTETAYFWSLLAAGDGMAEAEPLRDALARRLRRAARRRVEREADAAREGRGPAR